MMEVHVKPETETRLHELAAQTGRAPDDLVEDALAGYLSALAQVRDTLATRYDDLKNGRVQVVEGEAFFENLRQREDDLLNRRSEK
jgi:predicted transcriptional regulator